MKRHIAALFLLGTLIGCSSDWDPGRRAGGSVTLPETAATEQATGVAVRHRKGFASLPDRGELLAYDAGGSARQRGAYTSHPVRLSEEHAFRAAHAGGELVVAAPNGELLRLSYDHHVEHPDGNWTWVGRDADGTDAVVTFGEKAVFGTIPYPGQEPLRLTTSGGRAWLMATDRSRMPDINGAVTRSGRPDYLIPPTVAAALSAPAGSTAPAIESADVSPMATAANTIDVVLGFTDGYAAQWGGASQAVTRLNNLIVVANQALSNSLLTTRFRLVRVVKVSYPDATRNVTALEELTGYRSDEGSITVPAALRPLREARDEYGGDLVSLVRAFRTPENDGCGIAWLIGGNRTQVTTGDAPFGYSVVSDGSDEDGGQTYLCREESLAHEMGHNMGQAHNEDDSDIPGAHAYSYGYREASSTGFYTVMAYRLEDSSQVAIRYFANPSVNFSGRPTGVANQSDNARSLRLTAPIVAGFRATVVPLGQDARNDLNADGKTDLLWWKPGTFVHWRMNGSIIQIGKSFPVNSTWKPIGVGDLNGDKRADVLWQAPNGTVYVWMNTTGNAYGSAQTIGNRAGWKLVGTGDTDGDGKSDLQWFKSGLFVHWRMNGPNIVIGKSFAVNSSWNAQGIGDLNGDGRADVIWRAPGDKIYAWLNSGGNGYGSAQLIGSRPGWKLVGTGDINADGKSDLQWFKQGLFVHWEMDGAEVVQGRSFAVSRTVIGVGDLNGDGRSDVILRDTQGGGIRLWPNTNGNNYGPTKPIGERLGWIILPTR
jgi:hypothetical protein